MQVMIDTSDMRAALQILADLPARSLHVGQDGTEEDLREQLLALLDHCIIPFAGPAFGAAHQVLGLRICRADEVDLTTGALGVEDIRGHGGSADLSGESQAP